MLGAFVEIVGDALGSWILEPILGPLFRAYRRVLGPRMLTGIWLVTIGGVWMSVMLGNRATGSLQSALAISLFIGLPTVAIASTLEFRHKLAEGTRRDAAGPMRRQ
jgi:hypothetical protein